MLSPELLQALKAESEAEEHAKGSLIFDPFLGRQHPTDEYEIGHVMLRGETCFVDVLRSSTDMAGANVPEAVAELNQKSGHWQFANFRYALGNRDLLQLLASLRDERRTK